MTTTNTATNTATNSTQAFDSARLEVLEQAWRAAPYSRLTEPFLAAVREYVKEPSESALASMRAELQGRWSSPAPLVQHLTSSAGTPLSTLDLRLIDICITLNQPHMVLNMVARSGAVQEVLSHLVDLGISEPDLIQMCLTSHSLLDRDWQPTALGRMALSWLPQYEAEWLRAARATHGWGPSTSLVALALTANPPRLDLARQLMREANPYGAYAAQSARLLLKADPAGFERWARDAVLPPYPIGTRHGVLLVLKEHAPDLAFEFACQILRAEPPGDEPSEQARWHAWARARLRSAALDIAFLRTPATYLATVEDAAMSGEFWGIAQPAISLLGKSSYVGATDALRRVVEKGSRQARMAALRAVFKSAWNGKTAYALGLLGHRSRLLRDETMAWLEGASVDVLPTVTPLLNDAHAQVRLAAIEIVRHVGTPAAHDSLLARLGIEKQARVRRALLDALGMLEGARGQVPHDRIALLDEDAAAFKVAGAPLPLVWLGIDTSTGAALRWLTGEPVPPQTLVYLLHAQSQTAAPRPADVVRWSATLMQRRGAGDFALALFHQWIARGARQDEAWCLPLIATLGDERLVPLFARRIEDWGSQKTDKPLLAMAARLARALPFIECVAARDEVAALAERRKRNGHKKVLARISAAVSEGKHLAESW